MTEHIACISAVTNLKDDVPSRVKACSGVTYINEKYIGAFVVEQTFEPWTDVQVRPKKLEWTSVRPVTV